MLQYVTGELAWVDNPKYQSPEIINEMVQLKGHKVLHLLIAYLFFLTMFSLLADETRDIFNHEQVINTLLWVSEKYDINENFFGLVQVDASRAECFHSSLKDSLISLGIPFSHCRVQGYDGARNFQDFISGVAKNFKNENKSEILVHCLAHYVNLCLQHIARDGKCIEEAFNFSKEVMHLRKYSPKCK